MTKTAYLFPGQGSQFAGMGKTLADAFPVAREVWRETDEVLGFELSRLCFEGPEESLRRTENTQPAILAASTAAWRVVEQTGTLPQPDYVAGHSLGEYSALVAAGGLEFAEALRLVRSRGRAMQEAVPEGVGAMAALLRLEPHLLEGILAEAAEGEVVSVANFNSPDQVVIAGHTGAVNRAVELAKMAGAKRALLLPVSAPFHCSLMKPAQDAMRPLLEGAVFRDLRFPLVCNWSGQSIGTAEESRNALIQQIPRPVLWTESMLLLKGMGVSGCYETGPGAVLTGLLRAIDKEMKCVKLGEATDFGALSTAG